MSKPEEFNFAKSRRVTAKEVEAARKAIEKKLDVKRRRRGRPPKKKTARYKAISIRLHPKILYWAKRQARRRHIGYQTVVNEALLKITGTV